MTDWINQVTIGTARNGTTSHTVDPSSTGTVVTGAAFTPTAGRLLVCFVEGPVTSTTPSGWTLPTNGSAINNSGLYVFWKTAAGSDTLATTHNSSNFPVVFDFYEFPAGSSFQAAATATGVAVAGGAGPTLSSLTGTHWTAAVVGQLVGNGGTSTITWSDGTEIVDTAVAQVGTDGYDYGLTALDSSVLTSWSAAATLTAGFSGDTAERLVVAVTIAAAAAYPFEMLTPTQRSF